MRKKVLVVVDPQNDFLTKTKDNRGALYIGDHAIQLVENLNREISKMSYDHVFVTLDHHFKGDPEFPMFGVHCLRGTWGVTPAIDLKNCAAESTYFAKNSFTTPEISRNLEECHYQNSGKVDFYFAGVCTHICVYSVIASFVDHVKFQQGRMPEVFLLEGCFGDFDLLEEKQAIGRLNRLYNVRIARKLVLGEDDV